jgi:hypothetical protein
MKKVLFLLFVTVVTVFACSKEANNQPEVIKNDQTEALTIEDQKIVDEMASYLSLLAKNDEVILVNQGNGKFEVLLDFDPMKYGASNRKHDCEGTGTGFARCVKSYLDKGDCMKLGMDDNGVYYADVVKC